MTKRRYTIGEIGDMEERGEPLPPDVEAAKQELAETMRRALAPLIEQMRGLAPFIGRIREVSQSFHNLDGGHVFAEAREKLETTGRTLSEAWSNRDRAEVVMHAAASRVLKDDPDHPIGHLTPWELSALAHAFATEDGRLRREGATGHRQPGLKIRAMRCVVRDEPSMTMAKLLDRLEVNAWAFDDPGDDIRLSRDQDGVVVFDYQTEKTERPPKDQISSLLSRARNR